MIGLTLSPSWGSSNGNARNSPSYDWSNVDRPGETKVNFRINIYRQEISVYHNKYRSTPVPVCAESLSRLDREAPFRKSTWRCLW